MTPHLQKALSLTVALAVTGSAYAGVWEKFGATEPKASESRLVINFVQEHIDPEHKAFVANGGFEKQWPRFNGHTDNSGESKNFVEWSPSDHSDRLESDLLAIESFIEPVTNLADILNSVDKPTLRVFLENDNITIKPKTIYMDGANSTLKIEVDEKLRQDIRFYTKNNSPVRLTENDSLLVADQVGEGELFFTYLDRIHSAMVTVGSEATEDLQVPSEIANINSNVKEEKNLAKYTTAKTANSYSLTGKGLKKTILAPEENRLSLKPTRQSYQSKVVQLVDDRSSAARNKLYPVGGAKIKIIGTEFVASTDARGLIELTDIPTHSELLMRVADDDGLLQPSVLTVDANGDSKHIILRKSSFDTLQDMAGIGQNSFLSSICLNVISENSETLAGVEVTLDAPGDGPYYFNKYGMIDQKLATTTENGRACFFNIEPGATALNLYQDGDFLVTKAIATFAGAHREVDIDSFYTSRQIDFEVKPVLSSNAHSALNKDADGLKQLQAIEWASFTPLGSSDELTLTATGSLKTPATTHVVNGFVRLLSQSSDFEESILHLPVSDDVVAAPLLPRGYIEDMAYFAQVSLNAFDGRVIVDHGRLANMNNTDAVIVELYDASNSKVETGWPYQQGELSKTLFFNVSPGLYSAIVKSKEGFWISARNVVVYSGTVSYLSTGSSVIYSANSDME